MSAGLAHVGQYPGRVSGVSKSVMSVSYHLKQPNAVPLVDSVRLLIRGCQHFVRNLFLAPVCVHQG